MKKRTEYTDEQLIEAAKKFWGRECNSRKDNVNKHHLLVIWDTMELHFNSAVNLVEVYDSEQIRLGMVCLLDGAWKAFRVDEYNLRRAFPSQPKAVLHHYYPPRTTIRQPKC